MVLPPEAAGHAAESSGLRGGSAHKAGQRRDSVVIRFAGDSGDGMQLAGMQFTAESALAGNDIATLPDFPAEIRAPAGTIAGVSGFQVNFSSSEIFTAGDEPDVLVAMNPAALKANLDDVPPNGVIIADVTAFSDSNLKRAGFTSNPLTDHSLDKYHLDQRFRSLSRMLVTHARNRIFHRGQISVSSQGLSPSFTTQKRPTHQMSVARR